MAAHAVGDDGECYAITACVGENRDAILLFLAISLMLCGTGIDFYWHPSSLADGEL